MTPFTPHPAPRAKLSRRGGFPLPAVLLALLLLLLPGRGWALFSTRPEGARAGGTGCSLAADPLDPASRAVNPAAAALRRSWAFTAAFSRPFELAELDRFRFDAAGPLGRFVLGAWAGGQGRTLYTERETGLSLSRRLDPRIALGAGLAYRRAEINGYGAEGGFGADLGALLTGGRWSLGGCVRNVYASPYDRFGDRPAPRALLALQVNPTDKLSVFTEVEWERHYAPALRLGVEGEVYPGLRLRAGYDGGTDRLHLGIGLRVGALGVDGGYDQHPWLGWTRAFGLTWWNDAPKRP